MKHKHQTDRAIGPRYEMYNKYVTDALASQQKKRMDVHIKISKK